MLNTFTTLQTAQVYGAILCIETRKSITTFLRKGFYDNVLNALQSNNLLTKESSFDNVQWIEIHKALMLADKSFRGNPLEIAALERHFNEDFKVQMFKMKSDQIMIA
jgi:hypothetical protein